MTGLALGFGVVAVLAALTVALVMVVVAADRPDKNASPLRELGALKRAQVWLTVAIGAVGFGGMFAVYTYLASTLSAVKHAPAYAVPLALGVFGVGMTVGNLVTPRFADRALMPVAGGLLAFSAVALATYPFAAPHLGSITLAVAAIGVGGSLGAVLQTPLMEVAGDRQGWRRRSTIGRSRPPTR